MFLKLKKKIFHIDKFNFHDLSEVEKLFILTLSCKKNKNLNLIRKLFFKVGEKKFQAFAEKEACEAAVFSSLCKSVGRENLDNLWQIKTEQNKKKIDLYMNELDKIANLLDKKKIKLIALKNTGIAKGIHKISEECPMGDIDLLVKPIKFREAHETLLSQGYKLDDRSPFDIKDYKSAYEHGGTEYICDLEDGSKLWVELQWRPIAGRRIPLDREPSAEDLIDKSISIKNSKVRLLSPEDNLLQVCLHTAKHTYVRAPGFRLHTDVERIVKAYEIDWNVFCNKVEQLNSRTAVFLSLIIPYKIFKIKVPKKVFSRLNHSPLKNYFLFLWIRKVGLFDPSKKKWSKFGYLVFNFMLFDSISDIFRTFFPSKRLMKVHYGSGNNLKIFVLYLKRIFTLIFKRNENT